MSSEWVFQRPCNSHAQVSEHVFNATYCLFHGQWEKPDTNLCSHGADRAEEGRQVDGQVLGGNTVSARMEKGPRWQLEPDGLGSNLGSTAYQLLGNSLNLLWPQCLRL